MVSSDDIKEMIGRDSENLHLEFKEDIPVSPQAAREYARNHAGVARDGWWSGRSVGDYGRDKILEEVTAFANASGGSLFIGIAEEDKTAIAKSISPLPRITDLAGVLRNHVLACIEPRLPHFEVQDIATDAVGNGVLLIRVDASRLGPHRVSTSLKVPIRRGDQCMSMSMAEVHDLVLRNARRFDEIRSRHEKKRRLFDLAQEEFLLLKCAKSSVAGGIDVGVAAWLSESGTCFYGIHIMLQAHEDLGITRIEDLSDLAVSENSFLLAESGANEVAVGYSGWPCPSGFTRMLGGAYNRDEDSRRLRLVEAEREGSVCYTLFMLGDEGGAITPKDLGVDLCYVMALYHKLRLLSGRPTVPAELSVVIVARGNARLSWRRVTGMVGRKLPSESAFPRHTVSTLTDFEDSIAMLIQDFADVAGLGSTAKIRFRSNLGSD